MGDLMRRRRKLRLTQKQDVACREQIEKDLILQTFDQDQLVILALFLMKF